MGANSSSTASTVESHYAQQQLNDILNSRTYNVNLDEIKNLIKSGAHPNTVKSTKYGIYNNVMEIAIEKKDLDLVRLLIKKGYNLNLDNFFNRFFNYDYGDGIYLAILELLIKNNILIPKNFNGTEDQYYQLTDIFDNPNKIKVIKLFIKNGMTDVDHRAFIGLVENTSMEDEELRNLIIDNTVDPKILTEYLDILAKKGDIQRIKTSVARGALVKQSSALFFAIVRGNIELTKFLLENGASAVDYNKDWGYPISKAKTKEMRDLLISFGADIKNSTFNIEDNPAIIEYLKDQEDFLSSLTFQDKRLLQIYSTNYGYPVVNEILRQNVREAVNLAENTRFMESILEIKNVIFPPDANKIGILKYYVARLLDIFKRAPLLKNKLTVYRGVQREEDIFTHGNELLSTSWDATVAKIGFQKSSPCCLITITLKPGIHTIMLQGLSTIHTEKEILIGPPFQIEFQKVDSANYNAVISPKPVYRTRAGKRTYRHKNKAKKTHKKPISYS